MARAEAQRQRLKEEREVTILAGLDELERWIVDQLNLGLAGFAQRAAHSAKTLSTRLVDAKAPGLANRLDMLSADVFRVPEQMRGDLVFERLAALALICSAYRNQERLPPALKADVRRTTGWAVKREELLADTEALRVSSDWIVAATLSEVQPDKLRRIETWLLNATPAGEAPRVALLIDFVPVSSGPAGSPFTAGETLSGEVVFYPSAAPLRAQLATRAPASPTIAWPDTARQPRSRARRIRSGARPAALAGAMAAGGTQAHRRAGWAPPAGTRRRQRARTAPRPVAEPGSPAAAGHWHHLGAHCVGRPFRQAARRRHRHRTVAREMTMSRDISSHDLARLKQTMFLGLARQPLAVPGALQALVCRDSARADSDRSRACRSAPAFPTSLGRTPCRRHPGGCAAPAPGSSSARA